LQHELAGAIALEPFVGNGRAGDIAAQPFEFFALMGASRKTNYLANVRLAHTPAARLRIRQMAASWTKAVIQIIRNVPVRLAAAGQERPNSVIARKAVRRHIAAVRAAQGSGRI
jgi:hypothetical protein